MANVPATAILPTWVQVVLTAGGTTPSFGGVYATLVWSNRRPHEGRCRYSRYPPQIRPDTSTNPRIGQ